MKKLEAIIKPFKLEEVKEARPYRPGALNLSTRARRRALSGLL
jgi:hypothetical protein